MAAEDNMISRKVGLVTWETQVTIGNTIYYFQAFRRKNAERWALEELNRYKEQSR